MAGQLHCPSCHQARLSLADYESMMVLSPKLALFKLRCPQCNASVTAVQPIPEELLSDVKRAATLVGAGMGAE